MPLLIRRALFLLALALVPMLIVLWHGQSTKRDLGKTLTERSVERMRAAHEDALARGLRTAAESLAAELSQTALVVAVGARAAERALSRAEAQAMPPDRRRAFVESRIAAADEQLAAQVSVAVPWRATVFADQAAADGLPPALVAPGTDPRAAPWYRSAALLGGTVWDGPRPGPEPGSLIVIAATPVFDGDHTVTGVSAAGFDVADSLAGAVERIGVGGARLSVVGLAGTDDAGVLAASDTAEAPWTERVDADIRDHLVAAMVAETREVQVFNIDGRPHLFASEPAFAGVAHLVAVVPFDAIDAMVQAQRDAFEATTRRHLLLTAFLAVAVVLVVAAVALASAKRQARPIQELADAVRRIGRGDFSIRLTPKRRDELGRLAVAFNRIAPAMAERLRMRRDLDLAEEVQAHLLPGAAPDIDGLDIAFRYTASDRMGGDYLDFVDTGFGPCAVVADVSGHGAAAALLMATARAITRAHAPHATDPGDLLTHLNRDLARDVSGGRFMTAACLALTPDNPVIAGAGHHPVLVLDAATGETEAIEADGIPLGIDGDAVFTSRPLPVPTGPWTVLAATDGLEETVNGDGAQLGEAAIRGTLAENADQPAGAVLDALEHLRAGHAAGRAAKDDVTVLVIRRA